MRRIALLALVGAVAAGALAAAAARAATPADSWGAAVALLWTAFPLVLAARVCVAAQDRGWPPPWRVGVGTATLALAAASLARAGWLCVAGADRAPAHSVSVWAVLLAAGAAALALAVGAAASLRSRAAR